MAVVPLGVRLDHFEHRADIFLDIEAAEDRGFLRQIADAEASALVHRQFGDVAAVELDAAFVGFDHARRRVEPGRLAGAVRAEHADGLALAHVKADAFDHHASDEALLDAVDRKHAPALAARKRTVAFAAAARPRRPLLALRRRVTLELRRAFRLARRLSVEVRRAFR